MLKLVDIKKSYLSGENEVRALKGISVEFRKSEFVSILGHSGCGKTTLLNIIGGLDRYSSGDLQIKGKSTKEYKDRDWDTYRNHSVGFVFQSYNLISHQSVLSNVELALTLSGISKDERRKRAKEMLEKVGLGDQIHKKPNQLSGGQMQRVAIARALINNPEILLADEPTGALDSNTSVQIMELLKEIAKDRLVIMVTHNPELAEEYSTRIIKLVDGNIVDDSNPYTSKSKKSEEKKKNKKTHMKFFTALSLSLNNLMTKKGRTFLTAFAGSIGIIGIALILSLSNGVQEYINKVQEDTLSTYPLTIQKSTVDMTSMLESLMQKEEETTEYKDKNEVYSKNVISDMLSTFSKQIKSNNLVAFKEYLESDKTNIKDYTSAIQYGYDIKLNLYKKENNGEYLQVNPNQLFTKLGMSEMMESHDQNPLGMDVSGQYDVWTEMLDNQELLNSQYEVIAGKWPTAYNEVVLIVGKNNEISDYTLYSLGLIDQNELVEKYKALQTGGTIEESKVNTYSYDELLNLSFKLLLNTDYYEKEGNLWIDKSNNKDLMKQKLDNATDVKIVGIIRPNQEAVATSINGAIGYTYELQEYAINKINETEIAKEQKANPNINVFTGIDFPEDTTTEFDYNTLSDQEKAYMQTLSQEELAQVMATYSKNNKATYETNCETLGIVDLDSPSAINIYPKDFKAKDEIANIIEKYNQEQRDAGKEDDVINYTDIVGVMMNSVSTIIDVISYILIAFVAISLVVSSIMIGIITYISVLERTKEIGILRSIGASKKDISRVFNAETFIVGITAGLLGIGITVLLTLPINMIIKNLADISNAARLPLVGGIILVIISVVLTVIAGLIPAKFAAKKDPVEALRTE